MTFTGEDVKRKILRTRFGRLLLMPLRLRIAMGYFMPALKSTIPWVIHSREFTNFTYEITEDNLQYLAHIISTVTETPLSTIIGYFNELNGDDDLKRHVISQTKASAARHYSDARCSFGRRIGWYAFVRILKPRVVVETGVDKGLGSVLICAALIRNQAEGFYGRYYGTDINLEAGFLLTAPYDRVGKILFGDSIRSLESFAEDIDIFINDSDHSVEYERREYQLIASKLSVGGLILGDNCHCNDVLSKFSADRGRQFLFFKEKPKDHWYPGAGIGVSFCKPLKLIDVSDRATSG